MKIQLVLGAVIIAASAPLGACDRPASQPPAATPVVATVTPTDQSNDEDDLRITAEIRQEILNDESMSVLAQNCKIITVHGVVTLRGVVDSRAERDAVGETARGVRGVLRVENQLDVKRAG